MVERIGRVKQQLKHLCVINTVFSTNPKHSPIAATIKKINSISTETRTPFQRLQIDYADMPSASGYKHFLVIVDQLSGWVEAFPTRKTDTGGVMKALLKEFIPRYGVPESIESDRGAHFTANTIGQLYKSLGIERNLHTPYHAQSSGQVERWNRTLKEKIAKISTNTGLKWPDTLHLALWDVQNALQRPIGLSATPAEILFGRHLAIPGTYIPAKTSLLDGDERLTQKKCLEDLQEPHRSPGSYWVSGGPVETGEGDNIRLAREKLRGDVPWLEGAADSEDSRPESSRCAGYACTQPKSSGVEPGDTEATGAKRETPVKCLKAHKGCSSMKEARTTAQLKCLYTNAHSMGNKQEELEAIVHQENYDMVAITETWWGDSHNWSAAMDGYKLFRRDRRGRRGGGVALYVRESLDSLELDDGDDRVECLWVRIRGKANKADIVVGVCYRPPNQDEETDELFYKQLGEASRSLALVLVGDFNLPDVCWKYNTAERKQSRGFL
ncbi:hypothetical protein QYF61_022153 [Mycteria americana]|uniref:Integrase catalytic domain-containing protein n=1 Tax=Mycteria americana TaxID=33587 RepID=A0AAN7MTL2_MYCAM|nr:hypothetical protein QYF61_022153 [Mycteria americana]